MGVIIIREMVGTSPRSWSDAARQAVATASRTVRNIRSVEVVKSTAEVRDGEIVEYRVELKIALRVRGVGRRERRSTASVAGPPSPREPSSDRSQARARQPLGQMDAHVRPLVVRDAVPGAVATLVAAHEHVLTEDPLEGRADTQQRCS